MDSGSILDVGSSSNNNLGLNTIALARFTFWDSPPESKWAFLFFKSSISNLSIIFFYFFAHIFLFIISNL